MNNNQENKWTKQICEFLKGELNEEKYEVKYLEKVPYKASIGYDKEGKASARLLTYETDLLIQEKVNGASIPRIIIESKYENITTHDAITYSHKAEEHKELHVGLRYGLMIGNIKSIPARVVQHGKNFDFMMAFEGEEPTEDEWKLFVKIIKKNLKIASTYEKMIQDRRKKEKTEYRCIENDTIFHTT